MDLQGTQWIGPTASCEGQATFQAVAPNTGQTLLPEYTDATPQEIDRALQFATQAHLEWKERPREQRAQLLERIADELEDLGDELLERASLETALPLPRLTGERGRTTAQLRLFAEFVREGSWLEARIEQAQPQRSPIPKPDLRTLRQALGPVVIFGASNFPLAFSVAGGDTASALAAGCPVVVKAHPHHPGTSELVAGAIRRAIAALELPAGTFSLIHGRSTEVGAALVVHPATKAVGFTGSLAGGKALFDLAMARPEPIPVFAEMGSTNPMFLLPDAIASCFSELASGTAGSVALGVGQFCTNPGLLVALEGQSTDAFAAELGKQLDATPSGTMLHAGIHSAYVRGVDRLRSISGVQELTSSAPQADEGTCSAQPTAWRTNAEDFLANPQLTEEVFGPLTLLVTCSDREQMLHLARHLEGQLTATVHGTEDDVRTFSDLVRILEEKVGRLVFGGFPTGVEVCAAMHHGGPFPATTNVAFTSVGTAALGRFTRPICYQDAPSSVLPAELQDANPDRILRLVNGSWTREAVEA